MRFRLYWVFFFLLIACNLVEQTTPHSENTPISPSVSATLTPGPTPIEQPATLLPLTGEIATTRAEISGMAWYNQTLVILPQYPRRFGNQSSPGYLFTLPKSVILDYLDGLIPSLPSVEPLGFYSEQVEFAIPGFEGFESIAFYGDKVFLTIEGKQDNSMSGYLVMGTVKGDLGSIHLDPNSIVQIPAQADLSNMSDEAIIVYNDTVISFYEANGEKINPKPTVHRFSIMGLPIDTQSFPNLEYRLTDASQPDSSGRFWVINYFFPGDLKLQPVNDPIFAIFGEGESHLRSNVVERLIEFQIGTDGIIRTNTAPIQLELLPEGEARNWEGLVQLDQRGFLMATDRFPQTLFAFVPLPDQ